ncbi:hypothetical protein [Streptomyces soliscabiei]|uniref:hypothetical protein n=1 Tax=Streptomyces soliscabiei TaxID=588897 RepID=UPI0029AD3360|nr:hypothetical protein [Streptomyces sp. NY05-11A]MDX2680522.1 hypothetical protein [Streptomyces sp. NY05-11A]
MTVVDLDPYLDNVALTTRRNLHNGRMNVWGNSLPTETVPGGLWTVGGIPFSGPVGRDSGPDNIRCDGQLLPLPATQADWLHLLAASERRCEEIVHLHYASGAVDLEWIRVSDFWPGRARFGETLAARSPAMHYPHHRQRDLSAQLWAVRVPVTRREPLRALRLPVNPALHVFALTVETVR